MAILTKSKFMSGLQCPKLLWLSVHAPERLAEKDEASKMRMDEGSRIGELAKTAYPGGLDLAGLDFRDNLKKTEAALRTGKVIYEAGVLSDNIFSRIDILARVRGGWDLIEVKGTTRVKEEHIPDMAFQKLCAEEKGLTIKKCYLMHLNRDYVRKGEINPRQLFKRTDITAAVGESLRGVSKKAKELVKVLEQRKCPASKVGVHCTTPYECCVSECWEFLPESNVLELYRVNRETTFELLHKGVYRIKDLPKDLKLSKYQEIQKECEVTGKPRVERRELQDFFGGLKYPLHFLDFETFNTGIPLFDGLRPYQQVPFQFSMHIIKKRGAKPEHYMFLAKDKNDPRGKFYSELKKHLGSRGSIIVYNQVFEMTILKELAETHVADMDWFENVKARTVDLLSPFRNFHYYNPKQHGSASIKAVLPAVTGRSYDGMEIADGGTASIAFLRATYDETADGKERIRLRKALEKYCTLDTKGMIWIVEKLGNMSKAK